MGSSDLPRNLNGNSNAGRLYGFMLIAAHMFPAYGKGPWQYIPEWGEGNEALPDAKQGRIKGVAKLNDSSGY